jgi:hypothetical protein
MKVKNIRLAKILSFAKMLKLANHSNIVLFDLNALRNKRGEIGHQGTDENDLLSFLSWAEIEITNNNSLKSTLSSNENKEKLWNTLMKVPIDIVSLPDETFWLRDGHHRAKLADLAGFKEIPAIVS